MSTELADIILAFGLSIIVAGLAYWRGSLTVSGSISALVVGTIIFGFGGIVWGVLLATFFISSSLLSHYKEDLKKQAAEKFEKGHRRDMGQVLANGGLGSILALLSALDPSVAWYAAYIGVMATVTADTWATELGTLAKKRPRLITTGKVVDVGTSGGISPQGTTVALLGGLLIGFIGGLFSDNTNVIVTLFAGAMGGFVGSLFDSLLGATVQQIYYCDNCNKDTERKIHKCGHKTRPLRGWSWLNNDLVNLFASAVGGLISVAIWSSFI